MEDRMLPVDPPKFTEKASYDPVHYQVYGRHLIGEEKRFLQILCALALFTVVCTTASIILDKQAISGTKNDPSLCLLTDLQCEPEYTSEVFRVIVKICIRIDLLVSIVIFVTAAALIVFKVFNCKILVAFLLIGIGKTILINIALLLIVSNNVFYYNTVFNTMLGHCGYGQCTDQQPFFIILAFVFLAFSAFLTFAMTIVTLVLGSQIVHQYNESTPEPTTPKYTPMVTHFY